MGRRSRFRRSSDSQSHWPHHSVMTRRCTANTANDEDKQRIVCRAQMRLEKRSSDIGAPCGVIADHADKIKETTEFDDFIQLRDGRSDRDKRVG